MPEIPEMEHYRTKLSELLCGHTIAGVAIKRPAAVNETPEAFGEALKGRVLLFVERRGKHLLFHLDDGYRLLLTLSADSWLYYGDEASGADVHAHVVLTFDDGNALLFGDMKAAHLHRLTAKAAIEQMKQLGPDALDSRLTPEAFAKRLAGKKGKLKTTLADQRIVSGIGNVYADEIAFAARIHPATSAGSLSPERTEALYRAMRDVLAEAIEAGGYTVHPLIAGDESSGGYRQSRKVHDRAGEPCLSCGTPIRSETAAGRKMHFCPSCQGTA
ncbi:bifunctional DNA-formamidopyrimidine glycosylase/DNA-(apurinic or apyrimidinic site) lyase [Cohnella suwonensis]|uniref:Formamidopyrimidine-DNA glycosylase n=1 Tax=Cohnella suwonensis TaxID=696072 RepID=A0ABW0LRN0_9BACL